ncbi:hypothetical protein EDD18DRAFT_1083678 [Armillaria luteobubalina]|uniref:Uncharacterized protein n=1 Tax=Armillaria luteobubalina TaxID=153913 RepID=A0AA39PIP2_9AGAR|nr:hypothetical protein EDD18DRAFT_1083678 [Armillaria luteobubalina]
MSGARICYTTVRHHLDVPTLDNTTPHPLDDQVSSTEMREVIQTREGARAQFCTLIARPNCIMLSMTCICIVVNFNIADYLLDKPKDLHISELGTCSGMEPRKLGKIRLLTVGFASMKVYRPMHLIDHDIFANNRLSMMLLSKSGVSSFTDPL